MEITISLHDLLIVLVFLCLIVMLIVLTVLLVRALTTIKLLNSVLEDTKGITEVGKRRVDDLDGIVDNIAVSMDGVTDALKGKENLAQSLSSIGKAATSIIGIVKGKGE